MTVTWTELKVQRQGLLAKDPNFLLKKQKIHAPWKSNLGTAIRRARRFQGHVLQSFEAGMKLMSKAGISCCSLYRASLSSACCKFTVQELAVFARALLFIHNKALVQEIKAVFH